MKRPETHCRIMQNAAPAHFVALVESKQLWRWIFVLSEVGLLLTVFESRMHLLLPWIGEVPWLREILSTFAFLVWLFLLIASPFFLRSLRWLALTGWLIAFAIPFYEASRL